MRKADTIAIRAATFQPVILTADEVSMFVEKGSIGNYQLVTFVTLALSLVIDQASIFHCSGTISPAVRFRNMAAEDR